MEDKQIFEMWELFKSLLKSTNRQVDDMINWLDKTDFKFAPASTKYHNSFRGGLLAHSLDVYYHMYDFSVFLDLFEIPQESIIISSLLHDICKVNCYRVSYRNTKNEDGEWVKVPYYEYDPEEDSGHGDKSVQLLYEHNLRPTDVERIMIRNHMGFSNDEKPSLVSHLFSKYPQALILHWADESSTFIKESPDLQINYRNKLLGRNITESLQNYKEASKYIMVDGTKYELVPENEEVDNETVILINYNGKQVKVYAPYGDGLPF